MSLIKVLVVDDSPTMRSIVKAVLRQDPHITVIGEAEDAYQARDKIKELNPDVITLDIEMPRMSGLDFLKKIMTLRPMPVVMVSSLTQKGAADTIEALSIGAFECVAKPLSGDYVAGLKGLPDIIKAAANYKPQGNARPKSLAPKVSNFRPDSSIIGIGSSTGGVEALESVLSEFPENCPPTVITQHMPETFLQTFAARLDTIIAPKVAVAREGARLEKGHIYIAPGGDHHLEIRGTLNFTCHLKSGETVSGHRPSVDVLFSSIAKCAGRRGVGAILTGMGRDGAKGLLEMRQAGARTIGQDADTSVVYGMPKVAHELGAVQKQLPLNHIGQKLISLCNAKNRVLDTA
jgi:two-component system chemotaxis response regulator CheB